MIPPIKIKTAHRENYGCLRSTSKIKWIVIHYTGNDGDSDESNGRYFVNNIPKASAHYFVDDDSITQSVPDNYVAYSVGGNKYSDCSKTGGGKFYGKCVNTNSISIELCDDVKNGVIYPSEKTIQNALELTQMLMQKYNIPKSHIIRHFDVTGKKCPVYWVDHVKWEKEFISKVEDDMTKEEVIKIIQEYEAEKEKKSVDSWAKSAWDKVKKKGVMDGTKPKSPVTREQIAAILDRLGLL